MSVVLVEMSLILGTLLHLLLEGGKSDLWRTFPFVSIQNHIHIYELPRLSICGGDVIYLWQDKRSNFQEEV